MNDYRTTDMPTTVRKWEVAAENLGDRRELVVHDKAALGRRCGKAVSYMFLRNASYIVHTSSSYSLFVLVSVILCCFCVISFLFCCQYRHNRLCEKTCPQMIYYVSIVWKDLSPNDLLCVEWDVKLYSLAHWWLLGLMVRVGLDQRSCSTPGPVSTGMGDRSRVYHLGI